MQRRETEDQGRPEEVGATDHRGRGQKDWRRVFAHQAKAKAGDPWIATRIAADIEVLGFGGSRVVLWMVEWSAGLITKGQSGRTAY